MIKQFLITGGAGFLGVNMIRYLLRKGYKVRSLDRSDFDYAEKSRIDERKGDIRDLDFVEDCMKEIDIVIHCAAALPLYSREDIFSIDVQGTENMLKAAKKHGVERFIHISSTAVYGIPDHHPLYEHDRLHGVGPYGEAKIEAEKICEKYRAEGMCVPILRPKSFVGPERLGVFAILYEWAAEGRHFPMIGKGNNRYQLLDVEDLCDAIYLCCTKEMEKVNDTFNIGAKEFTTMREDFQAVLERAGFGKKLIAFPAGPVVFALKNLERLGLSPLYQWIYETVHCDSFVSIEKAEKILGFAPRFSNKQALVRNFEWYLQHKDNFQEVSGITHRVPWKQGALKMAKWFF